MSAACISLASCGASAESQTEKVTTVDSQESEFGISEPKLNLNVYIVDADQICPEALQGVVTINGETEEYFHDVDGEVHTGKLLEGQDVQSQAEAEALFCSSPG